MSRRKARILSFIFICLLHISIINVFADTGINFNCSDEVCGKNRLVSIKVNAYGNCKLSAATFDFTYDKNMFEFRSVQSDNDGTIVKASEKDDSVKVIFLNADGMNINDESTIFTVTLKAVNTGNGYLDFAVSDCVNSDVNSVSVGKCTSGKITVDNSSKGQADTAENANSDKSNSDNENPAGGKSSREDESTAASLDELGRINSIDGNNTVFLISGIAIGGAIVLVVIAAFLFGKRTAKVQTDSKNDEKGTTDS